MNFKASASILLGCLIFLAISPKASAAPRYAWEKDENGQVYCGQLQGSGEVLYINYAICVKNLGVKYAWVQDDEGQVYCSQQTKAGDPIKEATGNMCPGQRPQSRALPDEGQGGWQPDNVQNYDDDGQPNGIIQQDTFNDGDGGDNDGPDYGPPSYGWQDASKTMCVQYKSNGSVAHFVVPGKCKNAP